MPTTNRGASSSRPSSTTSPPATQPTPDRDRRDQRGRRPATPESTTPASAAPLAVTERMAEQHATGMHYRTSVEGIEPHQLHGFFERWPFPPSPERHLALLRNSAHVVIAAEDNVDGAVVGFVTALSDGV